MLILAIIMGGVTTLLFSNYMKNTTTSTAAVLEGNTVDIIVAAEPLKKNERISAEKLVVKTIPEIAFHPQTITTIEELEGLIMNADMEAGEVFLSHRVQNEAEENLFISRKVKDGFRAVSITVNYEQSVSTLIEPEDLVDVFFSEKDENDDGKVVSKILLEKVRVLAVGRKMVEPTSSEDYVEYSTVTFELKPEDAFKLLNARVAVADDGATIQLMLNSRIDEAINEGSN
jgi:pilus assembly protein CpaB